MIKHKSSSDRSTIMPRDMQLVPPDLPPPETSRWVVRRKAEVVAAIANGTLSEREACARYHLSFEELASWQYAVERAGVQGLRTKNVQENRRSREDRRR